MLACSLLLLPLFSVTTTKASPPHPNIVYILADDLGYGDVSSYNEASKIQTPHIDRIGAEGMRFTDAHTPSSVCTPTRYGILTGQYCWRTRLKYRVLDGFDPPLIQADQTTVPSFLNSVGYRTACIGKWHLGMNWTDKRGQLIPAVPIDRKSPPRTGFNVDFSKPVAGGPVDVGFDSYFGISASLNMSPFCYLVDDRPYLVPTIRQEKIRNQYIAVDEGMRSEDFTIAGVMPRFAGEAVRFISDHAAESPDESFFLYAPLTSPHLPVIPNIEFEGKSEAGPYGDFVVETDAFVGAILDVLDRTELADNTLIIFTSDNGGLYHWWEAKEADDVAHYKIRGRGAEMKELGHQGNAHLRGTKADIWEGGHRVPFLVRWPGFTPEGVVNDSLIELTDLLPTVAAITGQELPSGAARDGRNILSSLRNENLDNPVREVSVHHSLWGDFAIRKGPWKLIPQRGSGGFTQPRSLDPKSIGGPSGQLYNLSKDPSETKNLWEENPEKVAELEALLKEIQDSNVE